MAQDLGFVSNVGERRRALLVLLVERKQLSVKEVSEAMSVSEVTVRQDFAQLEREGLLQRVWGGAILPQPNKPESPFISRIPVRQTEKQAIAAAAIEMVADGDTVSLDASTTTLAIAQRLRERKRNLYVITNGLYTALELSGNPTFTVVVIGGVVRSGYGSLVGTLGEEVLSNLYTAKGFFSAQGLNFRQGLSESTIQEAQLKAIMADRTGQVIAVLDSTKLGQTSFTSFCSFEKISALITSGNNSAVLVEPFAAQGLKVQIV